MLEYIYEWIGNIAFYMIMVTAVLHLLPNSDYQKYIRFFTGLVLVILLATPILKIFGMEKDLVNLYDSSAYQEQMKKIEESSEFLNKIAPIEETAGEPQDRDWAIKRRETFSQSFPLKISGIKKKTSF